MRNSIRNHDEGPNSRPGLHAFGTQPNGDCTVALHDLNAQQVQNLLETLKLPSAKQAMAGLTGADLSQATDITDLSEIGITHFDAAELLKHLKTFHVGARGGRRCGEEG
jgi:hypothetical protein